MTEKSKLSFALELLTPELRSAVIRLCDDERKKITELRLRRGRYFSASLYGREYYITSGGRLTDKADQAIKITGEAISFTFQKAFQDSVHSFPRELSQGYITCGGGNRTGFCGSAVCDPDTYGVTAVRDISSINIRIAREVINCALEIYETAFSGRVSSVIIASAPGGGKTTVLRDLCRLLGNRYRLSLIDERGEIACMTDGEPHCDVGAHTDVLSDYSKADGVMIAVKVMSPEILVLDEIGAEGDLGALQYALNSGVKLICTCHASDFNELKRRPAVGKLIEEKAFDYAAVLGSGLMCGRLTGFYSLKEDHALNKVQTVSKARALNC